MLAKSNETWFDKDVKKNMIRRNSSFYRYKRYRTPSNKTKLTILSNRVCKLLWSKKREYFDDRITQFLSSPKRFFNELNRLIGKQKKNSNFIIADHENKLNTDNFTVSSLFNDVFVSISKSLVASFLTGPSTTEGLANIENSLFFYPTNNP